MMMDWLRVYNKADVIPFTETVDKASKTILSQRNRYAQRRS